MHRAKTIVKYTLNLSLSTGENDILIQPPVFPYLNFHNSVGIGIYDNFETYFQKMPSFFLKMHGAETMAKYILNRPQSTGENRISIQLPIFPI